MMKHELICMQLSKCVLLFGCNYFVSSITVYCISTSTHTLYLYGEYINRLHKLHHETISQRDGLNRYAEL